MGAGLLVLAMAGVALAAPWDGEWEGTIRHPDLPCSPCKVRLTISDGLPNIRSSASIPSFTIAPDGAVVAEIPLQVAGNSVRSNCRLKGTVQRLSIAASGSCGNHVSYAELELKRVSGGSETAVAALPAVPPAPPSEPPRQTAPAATPAPAPPPVAAALAPPAVAASAPSNFGAAAQAVRLGDMTYAMEIGSEIGEIQVGSWATSCGSGRTQPLRLTQAMRPNPATTRIEFDRALRDLGYTIGGPLDGSQAPAAYLVIGRVTSMRMIHCLRENTQPVQSSGSGAMTTDWHVVAARTGNTVYRTTTSGNFDLAPGERKSDGVTQIFAGTYRDMMRRLATDPSFRDALSTPVAAAGAPATVRPEGVMSIRITPRFTGGITANMNRILPSVVEVRRGADPKPNSGLGTGFVVDARGYVLTNAHVVGSSDVVTLRFNDGRSVQATVVRRDAIRDIALLQTERAGLRPLPIRTGKLTLTEKVYAVGNPLGLSQTVTDGIVSAYRQFPNNAQEYIQASVNITFGNSGGPLLDANGNVVGVSVSAAFGGGLGLNFFIPIESALQRLDVKLGG